jgi:signal recognition particle GTPase
MKSKRSSKSSGSEKSFRKKNPNKKEAEQNFETITIELCPTAASMQCNDQQEKIKDEKESRISNDDVTGFEEYAIENEKFLCDKSTAPSPTHSIVSSASFGSNWARERELESNNENLQEKLKDTEERLQSMRIQYDTLSQVHRTLRENHMLLQGENDKLKIDFQIINECTNVLRYEKKLHYANYYKHIPFFKINFCGI